MTTLLSTKIPSGGSSGSFFGYPHPGYASGEYYFPELSQSLPALHQNVGIGNNLIFTPFYVPTPVTIDRIGVFAAPDSNANACNLRVGYYTMKSGGKPANLIADSGTLTTTTTSGLTVALLTGAVSATIPAGWNFTAMMVTGTPGLVYGNSGNFSATGLFPIGLNPSPSPYGLPEQRNYLVPMTFGAMPVVAPTPNVGPTDPIGYFELFTPFRVA